MSFKPLKALSPTHKVLTGGFLVSLLLGYLTALLFIFVVSDMKPTGIEKQFRGFDNAMVETDYRYQELYWAGHDENWEYAEYQLEKIKLAIENGLERRPKRAQSAEHFLTNVLPEIKRSVGSKDTALFNQSFQVLTVNCNSCHAMEKLPFFTVKIPTVRQSSIRK